MRTTTTLAERHLRDERAPTAATHGQGGDFPGTPYGDAVTAKSDTPVAPSQRATEAAAIAIIDDQIAFAEALGLAISLTPDLAVAGRAPDADSGFDLVMSVRPDLAVCDYRLPGTESGIDCAGRLRAAGFGEPIMILTGYPAPQVRREAESVSGPILVLSKDHSIQEIVTNFRSLISGESVGIGDHDEAAAHSLSDGELVVIEMMNNGYSAAEMAEQLHLSLHTIRARIKSMMRKLHVNSQIEAVARATRLGIVVPPR